MQVRTPPDPAQGGGHLHLALPMTRLVLPVVVMAVGMAGCGFTPTMWCDGWEQGGNECRCQQYTGQTGALGRCAVRSAADVCCAALTFPGGENSTCACKTYECEESTTLRRCSCSQASLWAHAALPSACPTNKYLTCCFAPLLGICSCSNNASCSSGDTRVTNCSAEVFTCGSGQPVPVTSCGDPYG